MHYNLDECKLQQVDITKFRLITVYLAVRVSCILVTSAKHPTRGTIYGGFSPGNSPGMGSPKWSEMTLWIRLVLGTRFARWWNQNFQTICHCLNSLSPLHSPSSPLLIYPLGSLSLINNIIVDHWNNFIDHSSPTGTPLDLTYIMVTWIEVIIYTS